MCDLGVKGLFRGGLQIQLLQSIHLQTDGHLELVQLRAEFMA